MKWILGWPSYLKQRKGFLQELPCRRNNAPYVCVNCSQFDDENLMVSELFGHIKGRFSGGKITTSGATITWTTDEASDSQVEYGLTTS